ncbi:MAG: cytochrome C biogenesis protein [Candidatus Wallbacteria bacterium HGW-Wallbacteria-1]|jgi:cytochrome c biogenesis protein CcdA|uniref:Cytochrome C biogenesis protein n=1 Tax=Candidatus Wallbacteria bacterium HGW-Wallbacteria-1 TaxID=2013854 RepID=A0A2N1PML1_9BACT|nr:MAG: cytochrome C biogenesis protein [Candidatus Wallbacteria bacterium HGW-Wallbacteria-1]
MTGLILFSAFWLGLLTAISPCPLATNIAAISFIGRNLGSKSSVLISGLLYTLGRTVAYIVLATVIVSGLLGSSALSLFLQKYMNEILGPVLIFLGLILLGWIGSSISLSLGGKKIQEKAASGGMIWAFPIGILFALSFCPVSAGLFFGGLIPLAAQNGSRVVLPLVYGIGTTLPVVLFAFLIAFGSSLVGKVFNRIRQIESWIRTVAGIIFILVGIYYCLVHVYGLSF